MEFVIEDLPRTMRVQDEPGPGLVQVYTGNGKGKTTAALGLALRACGHRLTVVIIQFAKGVSYTGELFSLQRLYPEIRIYQFGRDCKRSSAIRQGFQSCMGCGECMLRIDEVTGEDRLLAEKGLSLAREIATRDEADIIILDEISLAVNFGLLMVDDVVKLIKEKDNHIEIVLTGRNMPLEILACADLITEMREVRHPYVQGIPARRGIEY
ncbi:MAG TPA: cob(I)yrinic acid a,c-diamide adenosyltransferase [Bacillota bacterium]|nr:cob(I)yrinic acid a,c-diamide adenosyltransferase [Bacillota bacterium]